MHAETRNRDSSRLSFPTADTDKQIANQESRDDNKGGIKNRGFYLRLAHLRIRIWTWIQPLLPQRLHKPGIGSCLSPFGWEA
jgi:hypothetical protein